MSEPRDVEAIGRRGEGLDVPPRRADVAPGGTGERDAADHRTQLRSRRWDAAPLRDPEVEKTDPRIAVAAIVILCAITLLVLVVGYGSGFWSLS